MAFLTPHFAYDVFVSYSHGDPRRSGSSHLKRWTIGFIHELADVIRSIDAEFSNLDIWFDEHIDPTSQLTGELRGKVKSSGILMVVMSSHYLASTWCKDELEWFREQVKDRSAHHGRVFVIRVQPTNETQWPDFLRDERGNLPAGFRFYDTQSEMPHGWPDPRSTDGDFARQLWTLQTTLTKRLRELRGRAEAETAVPIAAPVAGGGRRVYLHARTEYAHLREDLGLQLAQDGIRPLSNALNCGATLGDWARESKTRIETAKRCQAMALVRADSSENFIGDLLDIGIDERERIQTARGTPLPCAVLDGSGEGLPIDVTPFGIRRFDLGNGNWRNEFRVWLDAAETIATAPV
jgi:hypothetical protein